MFQGLLRTANRWFGYQNDINNLPAPAVHTSSTNIWCHVQTLLKGVGLVTVGGMSYTFFRSLTDSTLSTAKNNELVDVKQTDVLESFSSAQSVLQANKRGLLNEFSQTAGEIAYRHKRDVAPLTSEFQVNNYTLNDQHNPVVASLGNGKFVVAWESNGQDGSSWGLYGQLFFNNGTKIGNEFQINTYTTSYQFDITISSLANNEFIVAWTSDGQDGSLEGVFAQRFANNGTKLGSEFLVNTFTNNYQNVPVIVSLKNNQFVIAWASANQDSVGHNIYFQRFFNDGNKAGNETLANIVSGNRQTNSDIAAFSAGFTITWVQYSLPSLASVGIFAQRYSNDGIKLNSEFQVNSYSASGQDHPVIITFPNDQFIITWHSNAQPGGSGFDIYAQRFASNNSKIGSEFRVNTYINNDQMNPEIVALINNRFVITWQSYGQDGSGYGIFGQHFSSNGTKVGTEFQINTYITGIQAYPLYGKRSVTRIGDTDLIATWNSDGQDGSGFGVYARIFSVVPRYLPVLVKNTITIDEGETINLTNNNLAIYSDDFGPDLLTFFVTDVAQCQFERISEVGVSVFNFTQSEIDANQIKLIHDGSLLAPAYKISVYDGFNATAPVAAVVDFDKKPRILFNQFQVTNGGSTVLSPATLLAVDDRSNANVFFTVQSVTRGAFASTFAADPFSNALSTFTQTQVNASQIRFVHDGSNFVPTYLIQASDGRLLTSFESSNVTFIRNRAPELLRNQLRISKGEEKVLTNENLSATDPDDPLDQNVGTLIFKFSAINHGMLELYSKPGQVVTQVAQSRVILGDLVFKHDGSEIAPSYNVTVTDGIDTLWPQASNVTFYLNAPVEQIQNNNTSNIINNTDSTLIAGIAGGVGGALLLTGLGIFGAYRYRENKRLANERTQYPLANALHDVLKIKEVSNFQSRQGLAFVNAVHALENELLLVGIDIKQMIAEEIDELATKLKTAILATVKFKKELSGITLDPLDIQDNAKSIVVLAKSINRKLHTDKDSIELSVINRSGSFGLLEEQLRTNGIKLEELSQDQLNIKIKQITALFKSDNPQSRQHTL